MKFPWAICEKHVANNHQPINCDKCGLWIHINYSKINQQIYIYLMRENSYWYCMLCTKTFLPYSIVNDIEFKQKVIRKQVKFTHIAKPAISKTENVIKAINPENNTTKFNVNLIILSMTLAALFLCFTFTFTRCHFTLMNWKASYQNQKIIFK